jgi:hypothetical protein
MTSFLGIKTTPFWVLFGIEGSEVRGNEKLGGISEKLSFIGVLYKSLKDERLYEVFLIFFFFFN